MEVLKKGDFFIIGAVVLIVAALLVILPMKAGNTVVVKQDNEIVYEGSILKDHTEKLEGNTLVIRDGQVYMKDATCKNGVCVHTGKISKKGESIICLPHKVVVEIK